MWLLWVGSIGWLLRRESPTWIVLILWMEISRVDYLLMWLDPLVMITNPRWLSNLSECSTIHVFKEFILLNELVFKHDQLSVDFAILVPERVDLHLGLHVLFVQILTRLECHWRNFVLYLPSAFLWRAKHALRVVHFVARESYGCRVELVWKLQWLGVGVVGARGHWQGAVTLIRHCQFVRHCVSGVLGHLSLQVPMLLFSRLWVLLRSAEHKAMFFGRANHPRTFEGGSLDRMRMVGSEGAIGNCHDLSVGRLGSLTDHTPHVVVGVLDLLAEIGICTWSGWICLPPLWLILCFRRSWSSLSALGLRASSGVHAIGAGTIFVVLTDLTMWVLSLHLGIWIPAHEDATAVHVIVVHAHVELIYILNRLLLLVGAIAVVSSTGQGDREIRGRFWVKYFVRFTATFPVALRCRYTLLLLVP